ncbi:hypothetical protein TSUD_73950 [Trifolium subterraneum]|uniref:Uncharacterized protein n=1 Tax=Trifolium subterraneum TaxID=3900 RepID=A0A2Z6LKV9_TRISU|nr:hypothetical protein TSUD_73950 [Trifolium subterraneum]
MIIPQPLPSHQWQSMHSRPRFPLPIDDDSVTSAFSSMAFNASQCIQGPDSLSPDSLEGLNYAIYTITSHFTNLLT